MYCKMITTIRLFHAHLTSHSVRFVVVVRAITIYSLSTFPVYDPVSATVTLLDLR